MEEARKNSKTESHMNIVNRYLTKDQRQKKAKWSSQQMILGTCAKQLR